MNTNEVIAHLASSDADVRCIANDHVNASQSSNDVFPTAMRLAAAVDDRREPSSPRSTACRRLREKAAETAEVVKAGRTHLMDATPVTLGQEIGGYASQVDGARRSASTGVRASASSRSAARPSARASTPPAFSRRVIDTLVEQTGLALREAPDHFAAQGARTRSWASPATSGCSPVAATKMANDIRWMSSGPRAGLAEIHLPDLQPGSSIMPGKVNPVMREAVSRSSRR